MAMMTWDEGGSGALYSMGEMFDDAQVRQIKAAEKVKGRILGGFGFFFSSRRRHTRFDCDWSSDVCSSDLGSIHSDVPVKPVCPNARGDRPVPALEVDSGGSGGVSQPSAREDPGTTPWRRVK